MKAAPRETRETALGWDQDGSHAEREQYERSMRRMDDLIRWLDRHESWFLRELRWRDQGRIT
jgi:hypothetical protein